MGIALHRSLDFKNKSTKQKYFAVRQRFVGPAYPE
jgi:hypothetical protein